MADDPAHRWQPWFMGVVSAVILAAATWGLLLRPDRSDLEHDEVLSLLALTGHEGEFTQLAGGVELPIHEIHRLTRLEEGHGVGPVLRGLRDHDIHPPLYFLLARVWAEAGRMLGVPMAGQHGGPVEAHAVDQWMTRFSGCLVLLSIVVLLADGWGRAAPDQAARAFAAVLLAASPVAHTQAHTIRPYALLLLISTVALVLASRLLRDDGPRRPSRWLAVVALGSVLGAQPSGRWSVAGAWGITHPPCSWRRT